MRLAVIGGTGFIGSHVLARLRRSTKSRSCIGEIAPDAAAFRGVAGRLVTTSRKNVYRAYGIAAWSKDGCIVSRGFRKRGRWTRLGMAP
jgi:uncharacterized protein YbjT (DUF2867 family)